MSQIIFKMNALPMKKHIYILTILFLSSLSSFSQEGQITIEQDPMIAQLIALKSKMTQSNAFGERYKIQIFYGSNTEANDVLKNFKQEHPDWPVVMTYQPPNYKVWIGDFRNRLEADRAFREIKGKYRSAFVFQPKG